VNFKENETKGPKNFAGKLGKDSSNRTTVAKAIILTM
jgi:hypothetical protein